MNYSNSHFAILGYKPRFSEVIPHGQLYFPSFDRYTMAFRGIFDRQYYNNNGPLLTELESRLRDFLGVKHVFCYTNEMLALMVSADALELSGKVILPSFAFIGSAESLNWAGLEPVFCDADPVTHQLDVNNITPLIDNRVSAIMGVNLWGGSCDPVALEQLAASYNLKLYFDSCHAFGCEIEGKRVAGFGNLEVFSFHETHVLNSLEGGCVSTNNDDLADRLQCIRPSYGNTASVSIARVANARMSEAQAAIALMSLDDFSMNQQLNARIYQVYRELIKQIPGISLIEPENVSFSNFQFVVCEVDEDIYGLTRDELVGLLRTENVMASGQFNPGSHNTVGFRDVFSATGRSLPETDRLCSICLQLPIGSYVDENIAAAICGIISDAHVHSGQLKKQLGNNYL